MSAFRPLRYGRADPSESAAKRRAARIEVVKSFERAWALACTLVREDLGEAAVLGLRRIRSVERAIEVKSGAQSMKTRDFDLLANQVRYGGIGAYSTFLEGCELASMDACDLTEAGDRLASAFPPPPGRMRPGAQEAPLAIHDLRERRNASEY